MGFEKSRQNGTVYENDTPLFVGPPRAVLSNRGEVPRKVDSLEDAKRETRIFNRNGNICIIYPLFPHPYYRNEEGETVTDWDEFHKWLLREPVNCFDEGW